MCKVNTMDKKAILKAGLAKLKNHTLCSKNMRRTLNIKKMVGHLKNLLNEEINEMVNIHFNEETTTLEKNNEISTANKEKEQLENNLGMLNGNSWTQDEDEIKKGEEVTKEYLNLCLKKASLFKRMLQITANKMKNGRPTKKFNQYDVSSKRGNVILPRHHYFCYTIPDRAIEYINDETMESHEDVE